MPPSEILDQVSNEELDAKIAQYEAFVNGVLKRDLSKALELKEKYQKSLDDYEALEENIKQLREVRSVTIYATRVAEQATHICNAFCSCSRLHACQAPLDAHFLLSTARAARHHSMLAYTLRL